ncbi:MAG: hypothetical protein BWY15_01987 [Firmicutes bacterium ADurb.Bin193]|nr:MAG: hypothetical protein BWY15_01987 [Firmicutes bacterium ADurb.Bin193]
MIIMSNVVVDSNSDNTSVTLTGDIYSILGNRRALRFMKDCTQYALDEGLIRILVTDNMNKTLDRVRIIAKYARCDLEFSGSTSAAVQTYVDEENRFIEFSKKALDIRNNNCNTKEFRLFMESLEQNLTNRTLYDLQMLSAYHLAYSQNGCNFSVPGAGKTSVVYGAYAFLKNLPDGNPKKVDKILIIGPLNAFAPWESEYEECFGFKPHVKRLSGQQPIDAKKQYLYDRCSDELILISYASVLSLRDELLYFLQTNNVMVVLDEAHKIKNTDGGVLAQSILSLAQNCKSRVVLTGTPAPNGYEDLYNLFKFIWPSKEIVKFHIGQLKDMSKSIDDPRVETLLNTIAPYFIRIRKSDLGIPPATEHRPIIVEMKPSQRKIYDYIEQRYVLDIANSRDQSFKNELIRARLVRLMQAATNPVLLNRPLSEFADSEGVDFSTVEDDTVMINEILRYNESETPAKYEAVKDLITAIINRGEKVVVWACYIRNLEMFHAYLSESGIDSRILYGATPVAGDGISEDDEQYENTREAIIKQFHSPDSPFNVIIANPFAVSESISLHKACHNAIYMERTFNAAHFLQSKDRVHRYGLLPNTDTNYYYFLSKDSIDRVIHERLIEKERRLLDIIESMPIPLFDNASENGGNEDIKAVLRDYAKRTKTQ